MLSVILSVLSFAVLPACKDDAQSEPKRIIGIDSQKTYIKNDCRRGGDMETSCPMQLPIVSLDPISSEEIESVTLKCGHNLEISGYNYELKDYGEPVDNGYYRYDLLISFYGYPATRHVIGITVTIGGLEYNFSADLWFSWNVEVPTVQASLPIQLSDYSLADGGAEIKLKISLDDEIEITDVSFRILGITVNGLEYYDNAAEEWKPLNLPNKLNAKNAVLKIKYSEPEDCLYYGSCVQMTYKSSQDEKLTVDTATNFVPIRCLGSAFRG